jgi:hypothetical protein
MNIFAFLIVIIIIIQGLTFMASKSKTKKDGFDNMVPKTCPNTLIQFGNEFYLYNSSVAKVPGVNPLRFGSLEEYTEFLEWQRSQGIRCPVLFLQKTLDAQGNTSFVSRPSPIDLQGGLPHERLRDATNNPPNYNHLTQNQIYANNAKKYTEIIGDTQPNNTKYQNNPDTLLIDASRNYSPFNSNSFPGFDPTNQYIGMNTPLDKIFNENVGGTSPNPMDTNWGGANFTQELIDNGHYADREVYKL